MTATLLFLVGTKEEPAAAGAFLNRDAASNCLTADGSKEVQISVHAIDPDPNDCDVVVPSLKAFKELSGIKLEGDLLEAYSEFRRHYRSTGAQFEGWWKANKARFVVDVDGAMEALRKMMES